MFRILIIFLLLLPSISYADLYQWTDDKGVKHFSNTPPESDGGGIRKMKEYVVDKKEHVDRLQKTIDLYQTDPKQEATDQTQKKKTSPPVVIYTTPTCGYCHRAKAYFNQHGIRFTERDITQSKQARNAFNALNGRGVPLIVIGDQQIAGFNPAAINRALGWP